MDNQDKEFESFLRRFRLRETASILEGESHAAPAARRTGWWMLAAAAVVGAMVVSVSLLRNSTPPLPPVHTGPMPGVISPESPEKVATENSSAPGSGDSTSLPGQGAFPPIDAESRRKEVPSPRERTVVLPVESAGTPASHEVATPSPYVQDPPAPKPPPQAEPKKQESPDSETEKDAPGKDILGRACGGCHVTQIVETQRYNSRDAYTALVSRQVAMGAPVAQDEIPVLVDYLWRRYGLRYK